VSEKDKKDTVEEIFNEKVEEEEKTLEENAKENIEKADVNGTTDKQKKSQLTDEQKKIKKLEKEMKKLKEKENEYRDSLHRALAEFDNFKKRTQKEKEALYKEAVSDVLEKFLPVIDSIDSALTTYINESDETVNDGLMLVSKKIKDVLSGMEVEEIPAEGEEFDPNLHHAIMHMEDEKYDENVVVEVFQKGYIYKEKVIRPSMVKVAN